MTNEAIKRASEEGVSLVEAEETDLEWILNIEETAVKGGFVSGDHAMRHRMQMSDRTVLYLIAKRGEERVGFVILRGIWGAEPVIELRRIVIGPTDAGHGQAVIALTLYKAFHELNAHRVWLDVIDDNMRALHVYRKMGFTEEGRFREAAHRKDVWKDLLIFGMLKSEWVK
jgi:diamine N-acetyltransferase